MKRVVIFLVLGFAVIVIVFLILSYTGVVKSPVPLPLGGSQATLKTFYENPFDEKSQYINPLDEYKNPFDAIRAEEQNQ